MTKTTKKTKISKGATMTMAQALGSLAKLDRKALLKKHAEVFGKTTTSGNLVNLRAGIARKIAATKPPKTETTAALRTDGASASAKLRERDARLPPPGTVLERTHGDTTHKVKVLDDGFEYQGERRRSLSGIAKLISGQVWNGFAFFGLIERTQKVVVPAGATGEAAAPANTKKRVAMKSVQSAEARS